MDFESHKFGIVLLLTFGFAFASLLGYLSFRLKLSPILGYLLAGYLIGPYSPGFVANLSTAEQLAEIGVILMMFGVGLNFKWQELMAVKNIAVPGAIGQTLTATIITTLLFYYLGWSIPAGIIFGLAIGVASTVVLVRILSDHHLLKSPEGHISIGWLIVEDIITVAILILIPSVSSAWLDQAELTWQTIVNTVGILLFKFILLVAIMFTIGRKTVEFIITKVVQTRSHELFTLTILALTFVIASGSSLIFGTSIALGAFIAGMIIGQTAVRHQAVVHSLPMKDAFVVVFFLTVGMLFNPAAIYENFFLSIGTLAIILIVKPLTAFIITLAFKYPVRVATVVSLALAQIGEFSFILAEEATKIDLLPDAGYDIIVACAIITISINPILFNLRSKLSA